MKKQAVKLTNSNKQVSAPENMAVKAEAEMQALQVPVIKTVEPEAETAKVKVRVVVGTLSFEAGTYQKGSVFIEERKRVLALDQKDIEILGDA
jgi:hypothetical protein